jgi:hypothetical protein
MIQQAGLPSRVLQNKILRKRFHATMYLGPTKMTCITAIRVSWTILYAFDFHYPYLISEATAVVRFPVTCMALGGARTGRCVSSSLIG